jgi:hypothetical protein
MKVCWASSRAGRLNSAKTNVLRTVSVLVVREDQCAVDESFIAFGSRESFRCMTNSISRKKVLHVFIYIKLKEFL